MNIKEAKKQIKNAMVAYFSKDEYGNYLIPLEKQRPIFMIGAPGIGKTAIMEQIAQEMGIPLVSYSMTHHTRQSALGLPFISHKIYDGKEYEVSEYTMSEIIATVYDMIEDSGKKEGILFLDEINCVSETLSPIMLQFLQYKVFGKHRVPDGWIVVTAGNPPEYNNSVREFDIVTWDRLKRIDVEPDYNCWKEYAVSSGVHPSITTYLDIKKDHFYSVESTVDGKTFVTARGWEDLSKIIYLYEKNAIAVNESLVCQYLQNKTIAKSFSVYYDLYNKYKSDYQVDKILAGSVDAQICDRARNARFDERLSLLGMILDAVNSKLSDVIFDETFLSDYMVLLKAFKEESLRSGFNAADSFNKKVKDQNTLLHKGKNAGILSEIDARKINKIIASLNSLLLKTVDCKTGTESFAIVKAEFDKEVTEFKKRASDAGTQLENAFIFLESVFGEGQEMLIFVTELTINKNTARFISRYGCDPYFRHNKELLLYERQKEIIREIEELTLA